MSPWTRTGSESAGAPQGLPSDCASPCQSSYPGPNASIEDVTAHFSRMISNCLAYVEKAHAQGRPVVGIMCEFTPREIIMAAGAVPVCLCGGSADTIPDAERVLPSNLCPLIKSTFGYAMQGSNPFLEMARLIVGDLTCEGKKKMMEVLGEKKPVCALGLAHRADDPDALSYWIWEIRRLKSVLEEKFQTEITPEKLRPAIHAMNRERALRRELADVMARDNPPMTGRELLRFKSIVSCIPEDMEWYQTALDLLRKSPPSNGRERNIRVLMTGVPMVNGAERVIELVEACSATVVAMENCTGLKPILEDVDETAADPLEAIARKYYRMPCAVMTPNHRRIENLRELAAKYRPDCIIDLVWHACLTYDIESSRVRKLAEEDLGLPFLKIYTDYSDSDSARIKTSVEALVETVCERH